MNGISFHSNEKIMRKVNRHLRSLQQRTRDYNAYVIPISLILIAELVQASTAQNSRMTFSVVPGSVVRIAIQRKSELNKLLRNMRNYTTQPTYHVVYLTDRSYISARKVYAHPSDGATVGIKFKMESAFKISPQIQNHLLTKTILLSDRLRCFVSNSLP